MTALARFIKTVAAIVVAVIVVGILLRVLGADRGNAIVGAIDDAARWLASPFAGIFNVSSQKVEIAVNWGLAALVYAIVAAVIASLLVRASLGSATLNRRRVA